MTREEIIYYITKPNGSNYVYIETILGEHYNVLRKDIINITNTYIEMKNVYYYSSNTDTCVHLNNWTIFHNHINIIN